LGPSKKRRDEALFVKTFLKKKFLDKTFACEKENENLQRCQKK